MLDLYREETAPQIRSVQEGNNDLNLEDLKIMNNFLCKYFPSFRENFELLECIDSDITGITYKGRNLNKEDNQFYSFKFCIEMKTHKKYYNNESREIKHLKALHHKNIYKIYHFYEIDSTNFFSVSKLYEYDNINFFLQKILKKNILSETFINYLSKPILEAMNYMHKKKLYHMNITKKNIALESDLIPILIDFSSVISFRNNEPNDLIQFPLIGNRRNLSPELLKGQEIEVKYGDKIDIYSFGVTLYNLTFGCYPYGLNNKEDEVDTILGKLKNAELDFPSNIEVSECFKNFLRKVLEKDYLKRYSTKDALNDHWIKGWDIINEEKENIEILENFIMILIMNNSPKFNRYINL